MTEFKFTPRYDPNRAAMMVRTVEEAEKLITQAVSESEGAGCAITAFVIKQAPTSRFEPGLEIGINAATQKGCLLHNMRYVEGRDREAFSSVGEPLEGYIDYWYSRTYSSPVPAGHEVPLDAVRAVVRDFLNDPESLSEAVDWTRFVPDYSEVV